MTAFFTEEQLETLKATRWFEVLLNLHNEVQSLCPPAADDRPIIIGLSPTRYELLKREFKLYHARNNSASYALTDGVFVDGNRFSVGGIEFHRLDSPTE